ncbi:outer membrane lipoprotein carrier protein LolA [Kitasatospora nipponensis]|uniref:Outer membrane lipoprotein carrier protein LolA n=1 Tax=Kitasatospora nipponensis TaxID=258049 RepID=A0ABN1VUK3_9ACTN
MTQYAGFDDEQDGQVYRAGRRTAARVLVPVAIAAVAALGVGLVPALANDGTAPELPQLTAQQLVAKALGTTTQTLSGTVQVSTDLGVPAQLLDLAGRGGGAAGVAGSAGQAGGSGQARQQGSASADPQAKLAQLLAGDHTLRVSADGPEHQRIALVEPLAEYDLIHNGDQLWAWDSASNQAVHLTAPQGGSRAQQPKHPLTDLPTTPEEAAQRFLTASAGTSQVTVAGTTTVAGRSAYQLSVKPARSGSTIGEVRIAIDSATGTPLAVVATATGGSTVLDVHFSSVSFAKPDAKTFDFTAPKGAKVVEQSAKDQPGDAEKQQGQQGQQHPQGQDAPQVIGSDWNTVLSFRLPADSGATASGNTAQGQKGRHQGMPSASALVKSLGKPVAGGTLISTKVLNVLVTDDGRVFAGAVTLPVLQSAAGVK